MLCELQSCSDFKENLVFIKELVFSHASLLVQELSWDLSKLCFIYFPLFFPSYWKRALSGCNHVQGDQGDDLNQWPTVKTPNPAPTLDVATEFSWDNTSIYSNATYEPPGRMLFLQPPVPSLQP